jgi:hypothetical protein
MFLRSFALIGALFFALPLVHAQGIRPLNDTGITWSGHATSGNATTCDATHPAGQDCHYGRDQAAAAGQLTKIGAGAASFDFTKIANNGSALPASATLGAGPTDWACTRDNVTGLIWEVKTTSGLRSQSHTYSWYDTNSPDGNPGAAAGGKCHNFSRCDTGKYVRDVNATGLCGSSNWRMPTVKELESIADLGRVNPAIDKDYFPNTPSAYFWSGSPHANWTTSVAWRVYFYDGVASSNPRSVSSRVRLVHGGE